MVKDNAYTEQAVAEINQVIAQMRSNPTPELLSKAQGLLSSTGVDPRVLAELNQAIMVAAQQVESTKAAGMDIVANDAALTEKQQKLIDGFYGSLKALDQEVKLYAKTFEEVKKKEKELEKLNLTIAADPFSANAGETRDKKDIVILEIVELLNKANNHETRCAAHLERCHAKRQKIEKDETLTYGQKKAYTQQAEKDIASVEQELEEMKNQSNLGSQNLTQHLEKALLEKIAAKQCSTKEDYESIIMKGLPIEDKTDIKKFVDSIKNISNEQLHVKYHDYTEEFVSKRVTPLKETSDLANIDSDDLMGYSKPLASKSSSFAEEVKKSKEINNERLSR